MTDMDETTSAPEPPASPLAETVDLAVRRFSTALVIAGAIVGLAVYARPGPPRFEAFADGDRIVRVDSRKGTIIACREGRTCEVLLRSGQKVVRARRTDAPLPAPAAKALPAAPAAER